MACGVSQGSCLEPLLFLLHVNNILSASNFDTALFADDETANLLFNDDRQKS